MTLTEFLLARIADDEDQPHDYWCSRSQVAGECCDCQWRRGTAEREAKRQIVENHERNRTDLMRECDVYSWESRVLATVYTDHPDYDPAWKV